MVCEDGFAWNGTAYASLSAVAFAITGTKWNGYRFFGLRNGRTAHLCAGTASCSGCRAHSPDTNSRRGLHRHYVRI